MAKKYVFVTDENGSLEIFPETIRVKFGRDTLELINGTGIDVKWTVADGAFEDEVKNQKVSGDLGKSGKKKPKKQDKVHGKKPRTEFEYKHAVTSRRSVDKTRRRKRRNDPIIIIET